MKVLAAVAEYPGTVASSLKLYVLAFNLSEVFTTMLPPAVPEDKEKTEVSAVVLVEVSISE